MSNPYEEVEDSQAAENDLYVKDTTPLDEEEVKEAKVIIAKQHPLANTPLHQAFPHAGGCLNKCLCCINHNRRRERIAELRHLMSVEKDELDERMDKVFRDHNVEFNKKAAPKDSFNVPKEEEEIAEDYDPYGQLGFGFQAYFNMMQIMTCVFILLTIIMLPAFFIYAAPAGLQSSSRGYYNSIMMLGNMGFNKAVCVSDYVQLDAPRVLGCEVGTMSELTWTGIIPSSADVDDMNLKPYGYCGTPDFDLTPDGTPSDETMVYCTKNFLSPSIQTYFNDNCYNRQSCQFTTTSFVNMTDPQGEAGNTDLYGKTVCTTNPAKVYVQYTCAQSETEMNSKRELGLVVSICGCFAALFFLVVIWYLQKVNDVDFMKWDIDNLTSSDFTIEYEITKQMWDDFNANLASHSTLPEGGAAAYHVGQGLPVVTLEAFLEHYFTRVLNRCPRVIEDVEIRIANITFGFNNQELLALLNERGSLIAKGRLDKVPKINDKIDELAKKNKAEYIRPVAAFITFERQEGKDRALKYFCDPKSKKVIENVDDVDDPEAQQRLNAEEQLLAQVDKILLGTSIVCQSAAEPSDIIWENRHVTLNKRKCHQAMVFCAATLFLIAMFGLFVLMKHLQTTNMFRYPATMNCLSINSIFQNQQSLYPTYASLDQTYTVNQQGTGIYQCYCKQQGLTQLADAAGNDGSICHEYFVQYSGGYFLGELVTVVITVVNIMIRTLCIFMIKKVGYWTVTGEITAIMVTVYIMTFFNTAVLLLLADANLGQIKVLGWIPGLQGGVFPDLTEQWYIIIAPSLILTMFLNALSPLITIGSALATGFLFKGMDQGFSNYLCCKPDKTTKCKTIQAYVNLYGGPEHVMSYKYSALMNTVCVTFMYGCCLPELFPIAAITFFLYYTCDKFLITYYYQKPPVYDDKLNKASLELMKFGPLIMCLFGYWCMGNMQIFQAKVVPLVNQSTPLTTQHYLYPTGNQALPLFIVGMCILLGWIFTDVFSKCLSKMKIMEEQPEFVVDERLGTYFECLSIWDRKQWLAQEIHCQQRLGIATMGSWTREQLRDSDTHEFKRFKNAPNYEVICNPMYATKFQFTPIERCDTAEELAVSDTIMKVMYMGYTKEGHQEFNFKKALHSKAWKKLANKQVEPNDDM